ncbi:MAG: hypothetical protein KKA60_14780 [Proteobacteria bacterium]|nr:hypothetical protein [Pseudomonadota bacterium]
MRAFIEKIQKMMVAATFAEAGELDMAREILQEKDDSKATPAAANRQQARIPRATTLAAHSMHK